MRATTCSVAAAIAAIADEEGVGRRARDHPADPFRHRQADVLHEPLVSVDVVDIHRAVWKHVLVVMAPLAAVVLGADRGWLPDVLLGVNPGGAAESREQRRQREQHRSEELARRRPPARAAWSLPGAGGGSMTLCSWHPVKASRESMPARGSERMLTMLRTCAGRYAARAT